MATLFIGLGGVGTGTLDYLNEKMNTYNEDLQRQGRPAVNAHYYYIDTENARYAQHPEEFMGSTNKTFHPIGSLAPDTIVNSLRRSTVQSERAQFELLQKWYSAPSKTTNMIAGADTIRQYSRLAFSRDAAQIRSNLFTLIQQVTANQGRIYVITGSCGGTGCGIYMDILYMISEIYSTQNTATASMDARLVMAMPEGYVADGQYDVQYEKKRLNAFGTLTELNAICKDKNSNPSLFEGCYVGPVKKNGVFQPFRFGYMFDSAGLKRDEVSQKVADFLFELELAGDPTNGASTQAGYNGSFFDGLLTGTVDGNWNNSIGNNYVQAFNALGQYSIEKPDFLYRTFFANRLLFDVFHDGLIGKREFVDSNLVDLLTSTFRRDIIDAEITNTWNTIKSAIISQKDFANDVIATNSFTVFTKSPNMQIGTVKAIIDQKNILLQTIKVAVYKQCRDWLGQYDLSTVYAMLEKLDHEAYNSATDTNSDFEDQFVKAKDNSKGGWGKSEIKPNKALKEFEQLLYTWLVFEVNKALSSGDNVHITITNKGYLDHCKAFVERAKRSFSLENEQEHWDDFFIREVTNLMKKDDRSYIPDLNTIVDDQSRIIEDSQMWLTYDNVLVKNATPDFTQGTCTPVSLHERIIGEMRANVSLSQEGIDMDDIFDPTPGKPNSINSASKAQLFIEKYLSEAKTQIGILLEANASYQSLFANDILTRLQNLPTTERTKKCLDFVQYNKVQLKTEDMGVQAVTQYTYYVLSTTANIPLMQSLGIFNMAGQKAANSDHAPTNPFFGDKIVKLIVKNGYKIDDYRYFEDYKNNAAEKMVPGPNAHQEPIHDPFIDKRFLGELVEGKYSCNISAALTKIAQDAHAAEQAEQYTLAGCNDVQIYQYCLALLYQYYKTLNDGGHVESELNGAISLSSGIINIKSFQFNELYGEYEVNAPTTIGLSSLSNINNMMDLRSWIDYIEKKKENIANETLLYMDSAKLLRDIGKPLDPNFQSVVISMKGSGNKPVYDFFTAYLDWYDKK